MRSLTTALNTAMNAANVQPILICAIESSSGTFRAWSGYGDLSWGGNTYGGIGNLGGISDIEETQDLRAAGITLSLSGVPSEMISLVLGDIRQGKSAKIWLGALDLTSQAMIADPYLIFGGLTDVPSIEDGPEVAAISLSAENRLIDLMKPRMRRYTSEDQQRDYPNDLGFDYVPSIQDTTVIWGGA